jgi:type I restriction enzyme S subunit
MTSERKNIPELRFPEFSGIWQGRKLGESSRIFSGGTPTSTKKSYYGGEILFIRSGEIGANSTELTLSEDGLKNSSAKMVNKGDLLLAIYGATSGEVAISKISGAINQAIICIRPEQNRYFLLSWIKRNKEKILITYLQGGQGNLSGEIVKSFEIYAPTFPEQQKIASFLTAVDRRIELLKQKKEKLERYKKGVMQQLFTRKIRFKAEDGSEFPDWEEKKLGEVAKFLKGKGISKNDISEDGNLECIRYGQLYTEYGEVIDQVKSKTDVDPRNLIISQANDVIIPSSGETQIDIARASCVIRAGIALGGDLNIIRSPINGVFLSYFLNHRCKNEIAKMAQGISVVHLYNSQLELLQIEVPSAEEQIKIVGFMASLECTTRTIESQIQSLQTWKKGLLQQLFV